jgi:hypothetical protein
MRLRVHSDVEIGHGLGHAIAVEDRLQQRSEMVAASESSTRILAPKARCGQHVSLQEGPRGSPLNLAVHQLLFTFFSLWPLV